MEKQRFSISENRQNFPVLQSNTEILKEENTIPGFPLKPPGDIY